MITQFCTIADVPSEFIYIIYLKLQSTPSKYKYHCNKAIDFRDEILGHRDATTDVAETGQGVDEETVI